MSNIEKQIDGEEKKKKSLKERWKDKRERAKIELLLYGIFFLAVIVFSRVLNGYNNVSLDEEVNNTFINQITDNYSYVIDIVIDDKNYKYFGNELGHNRSVNRISDGKEDYFYKMNDKYYILDTNGNYILTNIEEVYPYIDYHYLDINNIKEYIKFGTKNNDTYTIKISDIVLNNSSNDTISITLNEVEKMITIDYTNLFKIDNINLNKEEVVIKYFNINSINSLEE